MDKVLREDLVSIAKRMRGAAQADFHFAPQQFGRGFHHQDEGADYG
jgi:hypothetical protein